MYLKSPILLAVFATCDALVVFVAPSWWQAFSPALVLERIAARRGFNMQHDGGHLSYSAGPRTKEMAELTLDLIEFPLPHGTPEQIDHAWTVHQVKATSVSLNAAARWPGC